jgi:hypothetical protein
MSGSVPLVPPAAVEKRGGGRPPVSVKLVLGPGGLAQGLPVPSLSGDFKWELPPAGRLWTGRRDLIGAWLRPHSGVSANWSLASLHEETGPMVTVGVDTHKSSHTLVAVDENGRQLGQKTVEAVSAAHLAALRWASRWPKRRWAIEDWHLHELDPGLFVAPSALDRY